MKKTYIIPEIEVWRLILICNCWLAQTLTLTWVLAMWILSLPTLPNSTMSSMTMSWIMKSFTIGKQILMIILRAAGTSSVSAALLCPHCAKSPDTPLERRGRR